ncbi:MAG TPA: hypothetical protein VM096_12525, partial [Vicinamibacterales bacterium]|nr:hypothetical protein [Vicinamibacterales bacterium]
SEGQGFTVERRRTPRIEEWRTRGRSTRRAAAAGAIRMSRTLGAAMTRRREVGAAEAYNVFWSSLIFLAFGLLFLKYPKSIAIPIGVLAVWFAVTGLVQAWRLYARETARQTADTVEDKTDLPSQREHRHA